MMAARSSPGVGHPRELEHTGGQSMLIPFHVKQKGLNTSCDWTPVEHSSKGNLICQLEKKPWGHLSASAWFHLCLCYFSRFCTETKTQRTSKLLCQSRNTSCDSASFSSAGPKIHSAHLTDGPRASCFIYLSPWFPFKTCIWTETNKQTNKKLPTCLSVTLTVLSEGGISRRKHFLLNEADSWHMIHSPVRGRILSTHLTPSDVRISIRLHKLFFLFVKFDRLQVLPQVFLVFTIKLVHQTILSGRWCPNRCAHEFWK